MKKDRQGGGRGGRPGFGPPPGFGGEEEPKATPGPHLEPADVAAIPGKPLYEPTVLRTLFLEFQDKDWEAQLADFYHTDVEVPATLIVDGKKYPNVGVHFRGLSSFMMVREGHKRSLNVSLDFVDPKQRLYGYKTLNLLNSHEDPTFLHTVLYLQIARNLHPRPQGQLRQGCHQRRELGPVCQRAAIRQDLPGASRTRAARGLRWKVKGSPGGGGGLDYIGDNVEDYKRRYEIKTDDNPSAWKALIAALQDIERDAARTGWKRRLKPILDIDGALWFLAIDNALVNNDGYWVRASDYSIFRDEKGKFHVIPHDTNETFQSNAGFGPPGGGFGRGGPGGGRGRRTWRRSRRWAGRTRSWTGGGPAVAPVAAWAGTRRRRPAVGHRARSAGRPERRPQAATQPLAGRARTEGAVPRPRTHHRRGLAGLEQARARRRPISVVDREGGRSRYPQVDFVRRVPEVGGRCARRPGGAPRGRPGLGPQGLCRRAAQVSPQLSGNQECRAFTLTACAG